jgi:hypothetical protein
MGLPELFSRRNKPPQGVRYDLPNNVRNRIMLAFSRCAQHVYSGPFGLRIVLDAIQYRLMDRYGAFTPCPRDDLHPARYHFMKCDDEQALDFIEAMFTSIEDVAAAARLVDEVNKILREEGVGYQLTPLTQRVVKGGGQLLGHVVDRLEISYPIIRKSGETPQEESMTHCLGLLAGADFKIANEQFLKAHEHYRKGEWDQVIAYCGAAFESVLKAVLTKKAVPFKKEATAQALILACVKAGILPQVYENGLLGIANVRNAMSDATHGRTPETHIVPEQKNAEHLLYSTAANIVFVTRCV